MRIRLIVRGTFSIPIENLPAKADFKAISILDRYLEHSRILVFGNGGNPLYYCTSADWMPRNFDRRIEVAFPVYDERVKDQLRRYLDLQWTDNCKARKHDSAGRNERVPSGTPRRAAQESIYRLLAEQAETERARFEKQRAAREDSSSSVEDGRLAEPEAAQAEVLLTSSAASSSPASSRA